MQRETAQIRLCAGIAGADARAQEQALVSRVTGLPGIRHVALGRNLAGSWGAGDYTLDLQFAPTSPDSPDSPVSPDQAAGLAAALEGMAQVDSVTYRPIGGGLRAPQLCHGIWRTLMFRVRSEAPEWQVRSLERDLLRMPDYMPGVRNWRLARVL